MNKINFHLTCPIPSNPRQALAFGTCNTPKYLIKTYSVSGIISVLGTFFFRGYSGFCFLGISLLVIKCECSYKILLLPDLRAMSQAIEKHVLEHKNKGVSGGEAVRIEDALISQVFDKAAVRA
jgi:hypothetical protein